VPVVRVLLLLSRGRSAWNIARSGRSAVDRVVRVTDRLRITRCRRTDGYRRKHKEDTGWACAGQIGLAGREAPRAGLSTNQSVCGKPLSTGCGLPTPGP